MAQYEQDIAPARGKNLGTDMELREEFEKREAAGEHVMIEKVGVDSRLQEVLLREKPSESGRVDLASLQVPRFHLRWTEFAFAHPLTRSPPEPWSRNMIKLYLILVPAYLCSTTNGFDSNTFGGLSALPSFVNYFSINDGNTQGLLSLMFVLGNIAGAPFAGQIADKFGRRAGMGVGAVIAIIGAIVQVVAKDVNTLIPGRLLLGMGALIGGTAGPAYVVEYAHPAYRGILTGLYQTMFFCASLHVAECIR